MDDDVFRLKYGQATNDFFVKPTPTVKLSSSGTEDTDSPHTVIVKMNDVQYKSFCKLVANLDKPRSEVVNDAIKNYTTDYVRTLLDILAQEIKEANEKCDYDIKTMHDRAYSMMNDLLYDKEDKKE